MTTREPALCIRHLTKKYDKQHGIFDVSLEVRRGDTFGFLGPNGAGKSTTINTVLDLLRPDSGDVTIFGVPHTRATQIHQSIGYLSGDMVTDSSMTGRQYLKFVSHLYRSADPTRIAALEHRLRADTSTQIKHLSRGNRQKIGLIAALMHDPDLLILDEPTSGLDPLMQSEFTTIIHEHSARGKTTFISSHILSEVQSLCEYVAFIRDGKIIHNGKLSTLRDKTGQHIAVKFQKIPTTKMFQKLKHISHFKVDNDTVTFLYHGEINDLLNFFTKHPVANLEISEPDLESLFMQYYEKGAK